MLRIQTLRGQRVQKTHTMSLDLNSPVIVSSGRELAACLYDAG